MYTFAQFISPCSTEEFFSRHWEEEPLHVQREARDYYAEFLTLGALDRYFQADNLSPSFFRVINRGEDCELDSWTTIAQRKNTSPYRVVVVEKLLSLFRDGATIIINSAQGAIPTLTAFCVALEQELKTRIQFNIYLTPPQAQGLSAHYDGHDVFVIQISGSKRWLLYDQPVRLPVDGMSLNQRDYESRGAKKIIDLEAGHLLYLPRGTVHIASTGSVPSVHITAGIKPGYWFNLVEELAAIAKEDETFSRALPHEFSSVQDRETFAAAFRQRVEELVSKVDVELLLQKNHDKFISNQLIDRRERFSDLMQVEGLTLNSLVSRRAEISYRIERESGKLLINFGRERISLPNFMKATLESLLCTKSYSVRDLAGPLSDEGKLELVKRFLTAGLLKIDSI